MADSYVQIPPDSTGKLIDAASMDVGVNSVLRQRIVLADNSGPSTFASVMSSGPLGGEGALVVRNIPSGTQIVDGNINISATAVVSGTVVIGAGTNNIGILNNISATVTVAGTVSLGAGTALIGAISLAAGTANIGIINNISATVAAAVTGVLDMTDNNNVRFGDSANHALRVSIVAGGGTGGVAQADKSTFTPGTTSLTPVGGVFNDVAPSTASEGAAGIARITANRAVHTHMRTDGGVNMDDSTNAALRVSIVADLSATAIVAGVVNVIGAVSHGAAVAPLMPVVTGFRANNSMQTGVQSDQAVLAWGDAFGRQVVINNATANVPSVSRGPICVNISTSATTQLIAAPGVGNSIYITMIAATNGSSTLGTGYIYAASQTSSCVVKLHIASNGGGFVMNYDPPIQISANIALNARVKPNLSELLFNLHFFVGPG